jgi:hypothetical protein
MLDFLCHALVIFLLRMPCSSLVLDAMLRSPPLGRGVVGLLRYMPTAALLAPSYFVVPPPRVSVHILEHYPRLLRFYALT